MIGFYVVSAVSYFLLLYAWGLVIYILLSWFTHYKIIRLRRKMYEFYRPFLAPLQRLVPPIRTASGYLDVAPAILLISLLFVRRFALSALGDLFHW